MAERVSINRNLIAPVEEPGGAIAVQSFDGFQNFNPHLHVISTDGCFYNDDAFMVCHCQIQLSWKHCPAMKCSKCSKKNVKLPTLSLKT